MYVYEQPVDLYVRRAFTEGWNPIVLPYDITLGGIHAGVGEDVNLSKLVGINPERPTEVLFEFTNKLEAGECGLVYIPKECLNKTTKDDSKNLKVLSAPFDIDGHEAQTTDKTIHGPYYLIKGAERKSNTTEMGMYDFADVVERDYFTGENNEYKLHFKGYYTKKPEFGIRN